jgi:hypothetical protein
MADTQPTRSDPIGDRYFNPLVRADKASDILFFVAGILSLLALVVEQKSHPQLYSFVQIGFLVTVVALFAATLAIRLYFSPRAQQRRYSDFLSHAFGRPLSFQQTSGYYNNSAQGGWRRIAAQVLENCFYTEDTLTQMCNVERMKVAVYAIVWLIVALNRTTDFATIGAAAQILFSEQIVSRWLRIEWLRWECEGIYEELFRHIQSEGLTEVFALEALGRYEISKATAVLVLSSKIFKRRSEKTDADWAKIRTTLGI